jgi:hypothetical protein
MCGHETDGAGVPPWINVDPDMSWSDLTPREETLLFKLLCENEGGHDLTKGLTPYGITILHSLQRKIGIIVVGVDFDA